FISIDCGASSSYTDGNSIKWDKDDPYIKSGENRNVETLGYNKSNDFGQISRVLDTVRVFPKNKKNCYSIKVAEGDRVLVRATFAYGNYDSKSSPPNFDLSINGNYWGNVVSNADWFYYEAIYTVKGDTVSVCLAQTDPNQFPFISGLEVRSLDKSMYKDVGPDYPLFASTRISYGLNEPVRFPDDTYDRIWSTTILAEGINKVQSDTSSVNIDIEDNPPKSVLQSGIETADLLTNLILGNNLPKEKNPIYINTYFSEVSMKNSLLKRSFVMYIDDKPTTTKPIIPPYKSVLEMTTTDITASSSTVISMKSTTDSTLPPLINAMEIFIIGDKLTDGTNTKDVKALALLQKSFDQLQEWSGDPCLPSPVTWDWIECNSDAMPRITALYLNGLGLSGKIPDFSDMDALQNIDLHNNSFTEEVPDFLGSFRKLTELNLANNNFSGKIPTSVSRKKKLKLNISGNPGIIGGSPNSSSSNIKTKMLLPVVLGGQSSGTDQPSDRRVPETASLLMKWQFFVSIDCGATSSYTDGNSITWVKDDPYIKTGENRVTQTLDYDKFNYFGPISRVFSTIRIFLTNKKNCYSIKVDKGDRVLVRATFAYGNYDNKSMPPNFDLLFNGNLLDSVVNDADWFYYEAIYTVKGDTVSVCLAQTYPKQFPFISGLEVRSLNKSMYKHVDPDYPLFLSRRSSFGANKTIRFPDDAYDRIWIPGTLGVGLTEVQSDTSLITVDVEDHPPKSVLQISKLKSSQKRSFGIYINDNVTTNTPIIPPYKSVLEIVTTGVNASALTEFAIKSMNDSTLPPLINALEVFIVGNKLTDGTNLNDVEALTLLQKSFDQLQEWNGDPCLPSPYTWDWVDCNSDAMPRIIGLYLNGLGLSGTIPDFSNMDALQNIDLHNNNFTEKVPDFLGSFTKLTELHGQHDTVYTNASKLWKNMSGMLETVSANTSWVFGQGELDFWHTDWTGEGALIDILDCETEQHIKVNQVIQANGSWQLSNLHPKIPNSWKNILQQKFELRSKPDKPTSALSMDGSFSVKSAWDFWRVQDEKLDRMDCVIAKAIWIHFSRACGVPYNPNQTLWFRQVFVSIDCGASSSYTDGNSIKWDKDDPYVKGGENHAVKNISYIESNDLDPVSRVLSTVRVFQKNKKNCYSIKVDKGDRVLVRATFAYGNYDNKSSPPNFDLSFNGNLWDNVVNNEDWLSYEVIYTVKADTVSVCLAQTHPNQFPFISGLEVRSLDKSMYKHVDTDYPLFMARRTSFGTNETVRFPDDAYDRIWTPAILDWELNEVQSDTSLVKVDVEDHPPKSVLQTGIESSSLSSYITLASYLLHGKSPFYINAYFSEVSKLNSLQKRSFFMYIDNEATTSTPIIPPYTGVLEMTKTDVTASSSTEINLEATDDSTLPPLINALEIFVIGDKLTDGTNAKDVEALALLQKSFDQLQEWSGDPCLPSPFTWDWVDCNSDARPRITALYLNGLELSGKIPDFSDMDALEKIDLHNNNLTGKVPDFLGSLPKLTELNLANNNFVGTIPASISRKKKLKLTTFSQIGAKFHLLISVEYCSISENPGIVGASSTSSANNMKTKIPLPVVPGAIVQTSIVYLIILGL
ncbi:hypothetical protein GIB67_021943, partial [Kingdonia uniflora]